MIKTLKKLPIVTKLVYLLTLILFILWVIPTILSYMNNLNEYKERTQALNNISSKYAINDETKEFSQEQFKEDTKKLFSQVVIKKVDEKNYKINIKMKQENLKSFNSFLETFSLRYYAKVTQPLEFKVKDEMINLTMTVQAF